VCLCVLIKPAHFSHSLKWTQGDESRDKDAAVVVQGQMVGVSEWVLMGD